MRRDGASAQTHGRNSHRTRCEWLTEPRKLAGPLGAKQRITRQPNDEFAIKEARRYGSVRRDDY